MAWFLKLISVLFFLLVESFAIGLILFILLSSIPISGLSSLSYIQIVGCTWGIKLLLNNIFANTTQMCTNEELGIIEEDKDNENMINGYN